MLKTTKINKIVPLQTILVVLLKQIYDTKAATVNANLSEEIKLSIVECIEMLFKRITWDVAMEFYTKKNNIIIAQSVYVCLFIIEKESYRKLR